MISISLFNKSKISGFSLKHSKTRVRKKGFTLPELIICIAIIAILGSFTIPKLFSYKEKAEDIKKLDTARKLYSATMGSYVENNFALTQSEIIKDVNSLMGISLTEDNVTIDNTDNNAVTITFDEVVYTLDMDNASTDKAFQFKDQVKSTDDNGTNTDDGTNED